VNRVLIVTLDGLRPDLVTEERMPHLVRLCESGTRLTDYHAAYPTHTRVQVSTLATGSYPGAHGITSNVMVVSGARPDHIVDTADYQHLEAFDRATGGRALLLPTLSDLLARAGRRLAVAGSGSPGSTILWTRTHPYRVINPRTAYGLPDLYALRAKLGDPPEPTAPSLELVAYAARAVTELFLEDPEVVVTVLWLNEPDASLHRYGLGAPEVSDVLSRLDQLLVGGLETVAARGLLADTAVMVLSDHGHSTPRSGRSLAELLASAPAAVRQAAAPLLPASGHLFLRPGAPRPSPAALRPLVEWLYGQPWVGAVLARAADAVELPGTLPLDALWGDRLEESAIGRVPVLSVDPAWSDEPNAHGIPGSVQALTEQVALRSTHGAASPYDLHAFALFLGPGMRAGEVSRLPAGAVDLVPTVLDLLGLPIPEHVQGRVLREIFVSVPQDVAEHRRELIYPPTLARDRSPILVRERVGTTTYVHLVAPCADAYR
jgi:arylsulfatase A-like enzyme